VVYKLGNDTAELKIIDQAGHTLAEPLISQALIEATNRFVGVS
jgi:hypothetical protein